MFAISICLALLLAQETPGPLGSLELVESSPTETTLDHPDLRDTHVVWPELLGEARERIDLAWFYVSDAPGEGGSRLGATLDALGAAAERGVAVRLLADAGFHETYPEVLDSLGALEGIELRLLDLGELSGGVLHAKYFLVDDDITWLGSQNCDWRSLEHIQELGVVVRSAAIEGAFRDVFEADWLLASGEMTSVPEVDRLVEPVDLSFGTETVSVLPVASPQGWLPSGQVWDLPLIIELIEGARSRVRVQLLTYRASVRDGSRWGALEDALCAAAERGVAVELLVADWGKRPWILAGLQDLARVENVSIRMVSIPEHSQGFVPFARVVHSKYLVCDGEQAWIGTSNWERGYFHESRNLGLIVRGAAFGERLDQYFLTGWQSDYAEVLDPQAEYEPPRIGR